MAIADTILEARQHGDLSENAEYHAAKEAQAHLETRISKLRAQITTARIVEAGDVDAERAGVGSHVEVRYVDDEESATYQLVGAAEASFVDGRLSADSPIGRALLGAREGDEVIAQTPGGDVRIAVVRIAAAGP